MNINLLNNKSYQLRVDSLRATTQAGSGHPSSCLSAADIVSVLFFDIMRYNPENPKQPNNDRFILSKGHAAPLLYAAWKQVGVIGDEQLMTLRDIHSVLEGHPTARFYYADAATGSLGCGLSIGLGIALAGALEQRDFYTYVLLGDSECAEGSVWEAAHLAAYYKAHKLIAIIDFNTLGQTGKTIEDTNTESMAQKFEAFGWNSLIIDGHDTEEIIKALQQAQQFSDRPTVIIARTLKGYGVSIMEDKENFHGKVLSQEQLPKALEELKTRFNDAATYTGTPWTVNLPDPDATHVMCTDFEIPTPQLPEKLSTREAYGKALTVAGSVCRTIVALDAEVNNSTYSYLFKEKFKNRFFQCFIAEQNMIGMAIGFASRTKVPFVSTFSAFYSRAFDQIRMAAIGNVPLRLVGSHCGISVGEDGPSQMGLEDIALMRTIPNSIIFYPCDGTSTYKLVQEMANYEEGISYLRTTREETKTIYSPTETFSIGGCKVLKKNNNASALIVAAGITVHEALEASRILESEGIFINIIDLYCIKPLDSATIIALANLSNNIIITVEDHYLEGGMGQAVAAAVINENSILYQLAVKELARSGSACKLRAWAGIDAQAIVRAVKEFTR